MANNPDEMKIIATKEKFKFLDRQLVLPLGLRTSPTFMMLLAQIESTELLTNNAIIWYRRLKEDYKFIIPPEVDRQIENALLKNTKSYNEFAKELKREG